MGFSAVYFGWMASKKGAWEATNKADKVTCYSLCRSFFTSECCSNNASLLFCFMLERMESKWKATWAGEIMKN